LEENLIVMFWLLNQMFSLHITMILCFETMIIWNDNMCNYKAMEAMKQVLKE